MAKDTKILEMQKTARAFINKYKPSPIAFFTDVLDVKPEFVWDKMQAVAESVRDNQKTVVFAGHGVSKTYTAARIALWFLYTHKPSTVITTAPGHDQVERLLWKELHAAYGKAQIPLGGKLNKTELDVDPEAKWFAYGFATKPDTVTGEATRMQGYHNKHVLIIFDEAAGIVPQIWKAADHLLNNTNCKILAIGNPTSSHGSFVDCENDATWNSITISVKDTPNFKEGREVIPEISGRQYESMIRLKYGEESSEYGVRVLGRKPEYSEGTYLGKWLADADSAGRIGTVAHEPASPVYTFWDMGDMYTAIWFVQFVKEQIRLVDFYFDGEGKGLPAYSLVLQSKPYNYDKHFTGWDLDGSNAKSVHTGLYTRDVANSLGIRFECLDKVSVEDRIEAAKGIMPKCWFAPAATEGVEGLRDWRKRKNEALSTPDKPVYFEEAVKSWGRHVGDAFSHVAVGYRYRSFGGERIGAIKPIVHGTNKSAYNNNVLRRGLAGCLTA